MEYLHKKLKRITTSAKKARGSRATASRGNQREPSREPLQATYDFRYSTSTPTILNTLSYEIFLQITDLLPLSSLASLALINRYMLYCMQTPDPLTALRDPANLHQRCQFLRLFECSYPNHILCHECGRSHPRTGYTGYGHQSVGFECPKWNLKLGFDFVHLNGQSIHWFIVHLIMRGQRLGPEYGDSRLLDQSFAHDAEKGWTSDTLALRVAGRLLVRERFFHGFDGPASDADIQKLFLGIGEVRTCEHNTGVSQRQNLAFDVLAAMNKTRTISSSHGRAGSMYKIHRCIECPSEYAIQILPSRLHLCSGPVEAVWREMPWKVVVSRYIDFGACEHPAEKEWLALRVGDNRCVCSLVSRWAMKAVVM